MAENTSAGTIVSISPVTTAKTEAALKALTYTVIGSVESLGEIGPQRQDVTFVPLSGGDVQHLPGATDNGATTVICGRVKTDPGQIALRAASKTKFQYALKIEIPDAEDEDGDITVIYVRGAVMSGRLNIGGSNDVTKVTYAVGNNVYIETQEPFEP